MNTRPLAILVLCSILVGLACNAAGQLTPRGGSNQAVDYDVDPKNTLYLTAGQPRTMDPAITHGGPSGPIGAIFSGLVSLDTNLRVQPELAAGWEVSEEGTVYTFYIRPEATFHDGRRVKAEDVIFSWERAVHPATGSDTAGTYLGDIVGVPEVIAGQSDHISGIRAIGDQTLEVRIDAPKPYFLAKLTYPAAYIVDQSNVKQPEWEHRPNGTGPFILQEWQDDEVLILTRNENYYLQPASVGHVVYLMGAGIPLSMYEKDQIDLVGIGGSTMQRVQDPNDPLHHDLRLGTNMCTSYIGFNNREPPFDDPLVRRAFVHAIDKGKLISGLFQDNVLPAVGPLPPGMPGFTGNVEGLPFDPQKARSLLAEAGFADPGDLPPITFTTSGYSNVDALVTALSTMWQDNLGVTVEPVLLDPFIHLDELYAGNVGNIFSLGWCADYPDPENFLDLLFHSDSAQNLTGYRDPAVDAKLELARSETDIGIRMDLYREIEQQVVADAPAVFLSHSVSAVLVKPYLENYVETPIGVAQWHRVSVNRQEE